MNITNEHKKKTAKDKKNTKKTHLGVLRVLAVKDYEAG
jgi:hypothetical protein